MRQGGATRKLRRSREQGREKAGRKGNAATWAGARRLVANYGRG